MNLHNVQLIAYAIVSLYEIFARVIPTKGNWSLIQQAVSLLDMVIKNKALVTDDDGNKTPATFTVGVTTPAPASNEAPPPVPPTATPMP